MGAFHVKQRKNKLFHVKHKKKREENEYEKNCNNCIDEKKRECYF